MPFVNTEVKLTYFLQALRRRIESIDDPAALIFFDNFLQEELIKEVKARVTDWEGFVNAGDFDAIYPIAVEILRSAAGRNFNEAHPDIYDEAHSVSVAFCEELNDMFQCSGDDIFDLVPIKSFVDTAVEAGVVEVEDGLVQLTPEGVETAQDVEGGIKSKQN